jgi:transcriptional regulator with XRE-family HTH domain
MKGAKPHEILDAHIRGKRQGRTSLSLRALARQVGVSPSFMSKMQTGAKPIPLKRAPDLAKVLGMDPVARRQFERAILNEQTDNSSTQENLAVEVDTELSALSPSLPSVEFRAISDRTVLEEWYYLPILDLVTCEGFEPSCIHQCLGLKSEVAERAWAKLVDRGWVCFVDGRWQKFAEKIRFPVNRVDPSIGRHHTRMLKKAVAELDRRQRDGDFRRRLIIGASVATNEESFRKAEKYLEEAIFKAASMLNEGPADRVYYLALQLFPLTRSKS